MNLGEALRLAGAWTVGILTLLLVIGGMLYGTWWLMERMAVEPPPPPQPKHVIIGLDLSQGNPLILSNVFSGKAARRVAGTIEDLPMRSKVTVRTFGNYTLIANPLQFDRVISRRHPPEQVRRVVQGLISGVPKLIADGRLKAQQHSNIVPFLQNMAQVTDCSAAETTVILVTDGLEESEVARLDGSGEALPAPQAIFQGCRLLEMLGLGQGLKSVTETQRLRQIWEEWAKQAGFESFNGLNDW